MTASQDTIVRLTKALKNHDVGELRPALVAQIDLGLSQTAASAMIDLVEALPLTAEAKAAKENKVTQAGFYEHPADGRIVKVQISKAGYPYAMERDGTKWRFVKGLVSELDARRKTEKPAPAPREVAAAGTELADLLAQLSARV